MISWLDLAAVFCLLSFSCLGISRGLIDQILRIVPSWGTVLLIILTQSFWMAFLDPWIDSRYRSSVSLVIAAIAAYPLLILLVRFLSWRLASTPLGIFNRIGGGFMGFVQGGFWVFLVGFILWLTPIAQEKVFYQSFIAKAVYPFVQKASTEYLWIALKTQPASWFDRVKTQLLS